MHLQRNAYQNYILLLTNNFKFYILQIFKAFNFLSVFFHFAKNQFANLITRRLTLCAFGKPLVLTIHKKASQCNCTQWVRSAPFRETHCYSGYAFSYALKNKFAILNNNAASAHCVNISEKSTQGVATPCYSDFASNFEIISRNENYAFNHNKNFYRNGNNQSLRGIENAEVIQNKFKYWIASLLSVARNDKFVICDDKSKDELFSRNDYGKDFIFDFWSNFNFGFLFNRKINSKKILFQKEKKR